MIKFDIKGRHSGKVLFTAEINCADYAPISWKRGLAVQRAVREEADLWSANLRDANLQGANLRGAYMQWADLREADLREADLWGADLRRANLRRANLQRADLREADLRGANLRGADLQGADLQRADLQRADLREADLQWAILPDAPAIQGIHGKVYVAASAEGALDMLDWDSPCGTTHCWAGWVVTHAGAAGKELEDKVGTPTAALAIYAASDPEMFENHGQPDFFASNEKALADMRALAEAEQAQ